MKSGSKSCLFLSVWLTCMMPVPIWLLSAAFENETLSTVAALLGVLLSILWWRRLLDHSWLMLGLLKVGAISLITILSLGWLMAVYMNVFVLERTVSDALERDLGTSVRAYASAVAYALCFAAVLGEIGNLAVIKKLESSARARLMAAQSVPLNRLVALIVSFSILETILVLSGIITYRAFAVEGYAEGTIPWYIPMLESLFGVHICLNGLAASLLMQNRNRSTSIKFVLIASFSILLFVYFTRGRLALFVAALLHGYWIYFFYGKTLPLKKVVPVVVVVLPILFAGALLNNFLRSYGALGDVRTDEIVSVMGKALEIWQSDPALVEVERARSATNLASRPLLAHPLAKAMALPLSSKEFMLGENIINSTLWAIPSAIVGDKRAYLLQEDLLYRHFPMGEEDTADSAYLYSYADFSFAGLVIYPLLIAMLWIASLSFARVSVLASLGAMVIVTSWLPMFLLLGESSITTWLSTMRNAMLAALLFIPLAWGFGFARTMDSRRHDFQVRSRARDDL